MCSDPSGLAPGPHFDTSQHTNMIVAVEPGTSTLGIYLTSGGGLIPPPAHAAALPVPAPLVGIAVADFNQDGIMDLVALSSGSGSPAIPNVTVYIGIGNGLFFTDPSLDPIGVKDGGSLIATGFIDTATDSVYPDVAVFNRGDAMPTVLLNTLTDRADIDGSGRVDGFDLALLARAFGADRGEDFTIQADGTLLQTGSSYDSRVVGSGFATIGQDLCQLTNNPNDPGACSCSHTLDPLFGAYGLPVDINLDGKVDGTDLALLAMRFGLRP